MANSGGAWFLAAAPAVWVAKLRRIPVIVNYRGGDAAEFFKRSFFWVRPTMQVTDCRVVPSGYLQHGFGRFGLSTEIVPNLVDLNRFTPRPSKSDSVPGTAHLIVTRNLEAVYDVGTALHAFALVRRSRLDARMTIAGGGPDHEMLLALAHELNVASYVTFTGRLDN